MGLSDPFSTTYAGAAKGGDSFNAAFQAAQQRQIEEEKRRQLEIEQAQEQARKDEMDRATLLATLAGKGFLPMQQQSAQAPVQQSVQQQAPFRGVPFSDVQRPVAQPQAQPAPNEAPALVIPGLGSFQKKFDVKGSNTLDDKAADDISNAIISGDQPPDLKGMYRYSAPVRAKLAEKGFDLTKAQREWGSVQKTIASLNSPQQVRMRQALDSVELSVPKLLDISDGLRRTGLKDVNWATINAQLKGIGPQRDLATQYVTQINLMKDELAQGFMGGGVPTDKSFKLADDILNPFYGKEQTEAAMDQLMYNLKIRKNAISGIMAQGIGGEVENEKMTGKQTSTKKSNSDYKSKYGLE